MLGRYRSHLPALLLAVFVLLLTGCASPASREAMTVPAATTTKKFPSSVTVTVTGGSETGAMDSSNISNADFKAAIEKSIADTALFKSVVQGKGGDVELNVMIAKISKPVFGFTFTVDLEAGWSLVRASDKVVLMRKSISSSFTATTSDAFAAVTRLRLAVEGAARQNIIQGLQAVSALDL
jgi:hypothetical protein